MYGPDNEMPWRNEADREKEEADNAKALEIREILTTRLVSIHLATRLEIGEVGTENLINTLWIDLRKRCVMEPEFLDAILTIAMESLGYDVFRRTSASMHDIGACGCHQADWMTSDIVWNPEDAS